MKVSIITSCYNRESTIGECIESVISQDYPFIEYIVIDGASKDRSLEIIKHYEDKIAQIISEPDHGMYEAINKGLKIATGDIIGLVHSDDLLFSTHTISDLVKVFEQNNTDLVYGNGLFVSNSDKSKVVRNWISGKYSRLKVRMGWLPLHPTVYIKKSCFEKMGLYNENYKIAADSELLVRYLYKAHLKVNYLNEYIVKMRMGGISTNRKTRKRMWNEDIRLYRHYKIHPAILIKLLKMGWKIPQFITAKFK